MDTYTTFEVLMRRDYKMDRQFYGGYPGMMGYGYPGMMGYGFHGMPGYGFPGMMGYGYGGFHHYGAGCCYPIHHCC